MCLALQTRANKAPNLAAGHLLHLYTVMCICIVQRELYSRSCVFIFRIILLKCIKAHITDTYVHLPHRKRTFAILDDCVEFSLAARDDEIIIDAHNVGFIFACDVYNRITGASAIINLNEISSKL